MTKEKLKRILELEIVKMETLIIKDNITKGIINVQSPLAGQEQFDLLVSLRQNLLRLQQLQGYSDNDFDGALDLVEAWLEMGYDSQGGTDGDSREETIIGDPETNQPMMDTSPEPDDQLESHLMTSLTDEPHGEEVPHLCKPDLLDNQGVCQEDKKRWDQLSPPLPLGGDKIGTRERPLPKSFQTIHLRAPW